MILKNALGLTSYSLMSSLPFKMMFILLFGEESNLSSWYLEENKGALLVLGFTGLKKKPLL